MIFTAVIQYVLQYRPICEAHILISNYIIFCIALPKIYFEGLDNTLNRFAVYIMSITIVLDILLDHWLNIKYIILFTIHIIVAPTNCGSLRFHPDPCSKNAYYECWQGVPTRYECAAGTVWDVSIDDCNWDYLVYPSTPDPCGRYQVHILWFKIDLCLIKLVIIPRNLNRDG